MIEAFIPISNDYLRAGILFLFSFLIIRIIFSILQKIALRATSKTKTDLDDKLIERLSSPLTFFSFLIALRLSFVEIPNLDVELSWVIHLVYSLMVFAIAYVLYVVSDVVVINLLKKFSSKTKSRIDDSIISLFHSVLNVTLIVFSLLYVLQLWGIEIGPLLAGLGVAGIAVALALQPVLSNIFSGASIILDHSVKVGDLVKLDGGLSGTVSKIGLRSTKVKTFDNEFIIVPNTKLADGIIQNVTLPEPKIRVVVPFSVAYGSNIDKVKKLILKEVKQISYISEDYEPHIKFIEMANSSLNFNAYFYITSFEDKLSAIDEANTRIYNSLNKAGIEIPFPQLDVKLKK